MTTLPRHSAIPALPAAHTAPVPAPGVPTRIVARAALGTIKTLHTLLHSRLTRRVQLHRACADWIAAAAESLSTPLLTAAVNGQCLTFHAADNWAVRRFFRFTPSYDRAQIALLAGHVSSDTCVWDVGANYGAYSLSLLDALGPANRMVLVEPHPDVFACLETSLALKAPLSADVRMLNLAAGRATSTTHLHVTAFSSADSRAYPPHDDRIGGRLLIRSRVPIDVRPLDDLAIDLFGSLPPDNVIKLDVQGFELDVLEGATRLIDRSARTVIFTEVWPRGLTEAGRDPRELPAFFERRNFALTDAAGRPRDYAWLHRFIEHQLARDGKDAANVFFISAVRTPDPDEDA